MIVVAGQLFITKKSGQKELFSEQKVIRSMQRIGLSRQLQPLALDHVKSRLHEGITTNEIFSHITEFLTQKDTKALVRSNLKQAIFDLGPTGFPFEKFLGKIFTVMGYTAVVDQIMNGECVTHEIDVLLEKDGKKEMVEAKFHNQPGIKTDIHVALYTYARFLDIKDRNNIDDVWIATNTKLTEEAIQYCLCKGIKMLAWNYPEHENLQDLIENPCLYPLTILTSLSIDEKISLFQRNIILCSDLLMTNQATLSNVPISPDHLEKALSGASSVCKIPVNGKD